MNIKCNLISRSNPLGSRSNTLVSCNNPLGSRSNLNALLRTLKLSALSCALVLVFATMNVGQAMEIPEDVSDNISMPNDNIGMQNNNTHYNDTDVLAMNIYN